LAAIILEAPAGGEKENAPGKIYRSDHRILPFFMRTRATDVDKPLYAQHVHGGVVQVISGTHRSGASGSNQWVLKESPPGCDTE
jgi:hypothetical protein